MATRTADESNGKRKRDEARRELDTAMARFRGGGALCSEVGAASAATSRNARGCAPLPWTVLLSRAIAFGNLRWVMWSNSPKPRADFTSKTPEWV